MSTLKPEEEDILIALDQVRQAIEVIDGIVARLKQQVLERADARVPTDRLNAPGRTHTRVH